MNKINVSVIIPVYGVQKYVEKCARSLFEQTMQDGIEFIFVDDCTKDMSIQIIKSTLEEYPNRKDQVTFIHHDINKGLAVARETGLKNAKGQYFIHCDSDDWVEPNMYEELYSQAIRTEADIVGCNYFCEYEGKTIEKKQIYTDGSEKSITYILSGDPRLSSYLWSRMIKKKFFLEGGFKAPSNVSMLEDMILSVPMHASTSKVSQVDLPLYHYRLQGNGMTNNISKEKVDSALLVLEKLKYIGKSYPSTREAYKIAIANFAQLLITQDNIYDPNRWRSLTKGISMNSFGNLRHKISPFLVRLGLDKINLRLIQWYRKRYQRAF